MSRGRIRTVKPEWRTDQRLLRAGHEARILSIALITLSDDEGRGHWLEQTMAYDVFPFDPNPIESLRAGVRGLAPWYVHLYEVDGEGFFQILKFVRHQYIEKPRSSSVPSCPDLVYVPKNGRESAFYKFPSSSPTIPSSSAISSSSSHSSDPLPLPRGAGDLPRTFRSPHGSVVRSTVDDVFKAAKTSTPTGTDAEWNKIGKRLNEESDRNGGGKLAELAAAMARGFHADPKASEAGWPLAWAARNPMQYVKAAAQRKGPVTREEVEASGVGSLSDEDVFHD